jgi:hypothetical protein
MRKILIAFCIFFCLKANSQSDIGNTIRIWPGLRIGYNFGAGIDLGAHLGATFFNYTASQTPSNAGIDVGYDYFFGHTYLHEDNKGRFKTIAFSIMNVTNDQVIVKVGLSKTSVRWGFGDRNKSQSKTWGYNADISYSPYKNGIFIGYHLFQVNNACMGLGVKHSNILYLGYDYPVTFSKTGKSL